MLLAEPGCGASMDRAYGDFLALVEFACTKGPAHAASSAGPRTIWMRLRGRGISPFSGVCWPTALCAARPALVEARRSHEPSTCAAAPVARAARSDAEAGARRATISTCACMSAVETLRFFKWTHRSTPAPSTRLRAAPAHDETPSENLQRLPDPDATSVYAMVAPSSRKLKSSDGTYLKTLTGCPTAYPRHPRLRTKSL